MKKLSSRLQSRLSKRRNAIAGLESEFTDLRFTVDTGRRLNASFERMGFEPVSLDSLYATKRGLRTLINGMSEDQQLDKQLLKQSYFTEQFGFTMVKAFSEPFEIHLEPLGSMEDLGDEGNRF